MCIVLNKKVCTYLFNLSVLKQLDKSREFWHLPPPQNIVNIFSFRKACCWYQDTVSSNKDKKPLGFHSFDLKAARSFTIPSLSVLSHAATVPWYPAYTTSPLPGQDGSRGRTATVLLTTSLEWWQNLAQVLHCLLFLPWASSDWKGNWAEAEKPFLCLVT